MEGNGIMVSAATGAMNSLLAKLAALLEEDYQMHKGMKREITFLKDELSSMNALLERLADMEVALDPQMKEWRNQVREMSYDIEDCIDEYTRQLRHERPQRSGGNGIIGFFHGYVHKVKDLVGRHEIAEQIQELKARIVEAGHRRKRYKLDSAVNCESNHVVSIDRRLPALYAELDALVGIDGPRDEIIKLFDDGEQRMKVVSIVGSGGLGKTTLANQVYQKIGNQFDCKAFVSLSQHPDMGMIFQTILYQVNDEVGRIRSGDKEQVINELRAFLKNKRYFIVIDDIWSSQAWKTIRYSLLENNCGSRILVTTRIGTVAKSCSSPCLDLVYELRVLSEDDSRRLFFRRIFGFEDKCPHPLKDIAVEIVRKCGGLPLAIISMASLLTTKSYVRAEWFKVRDSIGSGIEKNSDVEEMNMILSLSYYDLPHHLRTCLLYLSMFPEDYVINRDYLVRRWVAEGFIKANGGRTFEEEGECYFNELINRSMIQPVHTQYDGRVYSCKVHDMILDLIISKASEENFVTIVTDRKQMLVSKDKVHRLSFDNYGQEDVTLYSMVTTHVRSLNIFRYSEQMPPLSNFPALRMLDIDGNNNLESSYLEDIVKLFQLRYLRIRASNISLPDQIGELQFLVILDLLNCIGISKLPASIVRLRHLKWLVVHRVELPDGVGNLQALEYMSLMIVDSSTSVSSLQELGTLTKLRTLGLDWRISDFHKEKLTYTDNFVSSLGKLGRSNLQYLTLISPWSLDFLLDSWSPPPHLLQRLGITGWYLSRIPVWMASLANLTYLDIEVKVRQETLQILGNFPALQFLKLYSNAADHSDRWLTISSNGFRCLQKFKFVHWMNLMFEEGAMPMLETLEFQIIAHEARSECGFCPPDIGICHLSALKNLVIDMFCECARVEEVEALEAAIRIAASTLPNHPTPNLKRFREAEMVKNRPGNQSKFTTLNIQVDLGQTSEAKSRKTQGRTDLRCKLVQECGRTAEEMDGFTVSVATGVMNSLIDKLTTLLAQEFRLHKGVQHNIALLNGELTCMNALLEKLADMEVLDPLMKEWRNQELLARREVAQQIKVLKDDIVEASHRRKRYKIDPELYSETTNVVAIDPRLPALYVEASNLVGIDIPRDQLINLVDDGDQSFKVISIVGVGGLGKTTLANEVYKKVGGKFYCQAFVSVSQKPDVKKILRSIICQIMEPYHASTNPDKAVISQIKKQDYSSTESGDVEWLINILRVFLKDKRYLIVIDDIWSTQEWMTIKFALFENTCGSRILVTTRISTIAKSCCSPDHGTVYELRPLSEVDFMCLFFRRIFGSEDLCPVNLKDVSTEIIKKCGGLPLAIVTMASLLADKSDRREEWVRIRNSIGSGLEKKYDLEVMRSILSLSYSDLSHHLKTCLLYLSIYPEDYKIDMHKLVRRWIAEGFIKDKSGRNLMVEGKCYFNELINRSMIQPVDIGIDGQPKACRVHDMILDLIVSKAVDENFSTSLGDETHRLASQAKIRRLSVDYCGQEISVPWPSMMLAHVRSLSIFGYSEQMPPISDFKALRVLDLESSVKLQNSDLNNVVDLFQLRYLRIAASRITHLPEQIGELQFLETLDLCRTWIRKLPASIVKLRRLSCFSANGAQLPDGVGKMQSLQELSGITVYDECSTNSLLELGTLNSLRTLKLNWYIRESRKDRTHYTDSLASSLGKLVGSNLESLSIINGPFSGCIPFDSWSWSSSPHLLQELYIPKCCFQRIPDWMASMNNLYRLCIRSKQVTQQILQILGDLPALLDLELRSESDDPMEILIISSDIFRCLKIFRLYGSFVGLIFKDGSMQKVREISIVVRANEAKSAFADHPDLGIRNLTSLMDLNVWINCERARVQEVKVLEAAIADATALLPNHPTPHFFRENEEKMVEDEAQMQVKLFE
uniref:AAA+ ATPase domain-containing protein n=1 Tax=Oryza punctata TaxID=4537 RepID=A0A0E0MHE8_ORYPU